MNYQCDVPSNLKGLFVNPGFACLLSGSVDGIPTTDMTLIDVFFTAYAVNEVESVATFSFPEIFTWRHISQPGHPMIPRKCVLRHSRVHTNCQWGGGMSTTTRGLHGLCRQVGTIILRCLALLVMV